MAGTDVRQLLLQVDASVALAQRNLNALARTVDQETRSMERALLTPEARLENLGRAFASLDQVVIASANQQAAFGTVVDRVSSQELRAAQAIQNLARATAGMTPQVTIATREQLQAAAAIGSFAQATVNATDRMGGAVRAGGANSAMAAQQFQDFFIQIQAGQSPLIAATQQMSQLTFAYMYSEGAAGKFARFMGGGWGTLILGGVMVLGYLTKGLFDTRTEIEKATDELEENARKAELTRRAQEAYGRTLPGVTERIREQNEALSAQNRTLEQNQQLVLQQARSEVGNAAAAAAGKVRELEAAVRRLTSAEESVRNATDPQIRLSFMGEVERARDDVERLAGEVNQAAQEIRNAQAGIFEAQVPIARSEAEALIDPIEAINRRYREMEAAAIGAARGNRELTARLTETIAALGRLRNAEIRAHQEANREGARSRTPQQAFRDFQTEAARRGIQLTPGGGHRTAEHQNRLHRQGLTPLDGYNRPSRHQNWQAFDPRSRTHSDAAAMAAAQQAGLRNFEIVRESGGRVHYEWSGHGRRGEVDVAGAERRAAAAERDRLARQRAEEAFQQALLRANDDLIDARRALAISAEEQVRFALEDVDNERARADSEADLRALSAERAGIEREVAQGLAAQEKAINEQVAEDRRSLILRRDARRIDEQQHRGAMAELDLERETAQAQAGLAETTAERRASALRLLDLSKEAERRELERMAADDQLDKVARRVALERLQRLDTIYGARREGIERDHEGPRARYLRELRNGAASVNEQLEQIEVDAVRDLNEELAAAAAGALGLEGALGRVVERLIAMAIETQVLLPLMERMMGARGGGGGGGLFSLIGGLFGGAGGASGGGGGLVALAGARAGGGPVSAGLPYLVGERGPEIVIPKAPSIVIPNHAIRAGGGGNSFTVHVHAKDAVLTETVKGWVIEGMQAAAQASAGHTDARLKQITRPPLV